MSTGYIHFTDEQKEIARQTDIADLLRRQGETLKRSGSEMEWRDGSQKVTVWGNLWFHQYDQEVQWYEVKQINRKDLRKSCRKSGGYVGKRQH